MRDIPQSVDVAVIGAGVSGLTTAYDLKRNGRDDFLVFEAESYAGGRTRMSVIDDEFVPGGAGVVYVGTESDQLCEELNIERFPIKPTIYCVHYNGVTVTAGNDNQLVAGLPFSVAAKAELSMLLKTLRADYARVMDRGLGAASDELGQKTFEQYLGSIESVEIREFLASIVFAACHLTPAQISAKFALRYFLSKVFKDGEQSSYIPKGMQQIPLGMLDAVSDRVCYRAEVLSTEILADGRYSLKIRRDDDRIMVTANHLVIAVPGPNVKRLAPWLPAEKISAIDGVGGTPQLVISMVLVHQGNWDWEGVFMTPVVGRAFDWVTDCRAGTGLTTTRTTLQLGVARDRALRAFSKTDDQLISEWLEDLDVVFPGSKRLFFGAEVHRWPLCFAVLRADRHLYQADASCAVGNTHFAGDYASATAGVHGCIAVAKGIVQTILNGS